MEKFIVLDTETTNSIDEPICYDIGFAVVDKLGNVYETRSYAIAETFLNKEMMSSAYFLEKVPSYWEEIKNGDRVLANLFVVRRELKSLCEKYDVKKIFAHNARFDYRSCQTTQRYLTKSKYRFFFPYGIEICDTLKMARQVLHNNEDYCAFCTKNDYFTSRGVKRYTAEIIYRFLKNDVDFVEEHRGLDDVLIEKDILAYCLSVDENIDGRLWAD